MSLAASSTIHQPARVGDAAHRIASTAGRIEPTTPGTARQATPVADAAHQVVELVNAERGRLGLRPLVRDPRLALAAGVHAADMAATGVMRHAGSDGSDGGTRIARTGYGYAAWGENVGTGPSDPAATVAAWLDSAPHRANLLGEFTDVGVAVAAAADGTTYWTLVVARPTGIP